MNTHTYTTLAEATDALTHMGYTESFITNNNVLATADKLKSFELDEITVKQSFRFDGMTNPADETQLLAIETRDGTKGTFIISHGSEKNHNSQVIRELTQKSKS